MLKRITLVGVFGTIVISCSGEGSDPQVLQQALQSETQCGGNKSAVCHVPPGNPGNAHTICVSNNAVKAHLKHGDTLGACQPVTASCTVDAALQYSVQVEPAGPITWEQARAPSGPVVPYTSDDFQISSQGYFDGNGQHAYGVSRGVVRFPAASCVPEGATITAARLELLTKAFGGGLAGSDGQMPVYLLHIVSHTPTDPLIPVPEDYELSHWGTEKWAEVPMDSFAPSTVEQIELNPAGVASISRTTHNYFGLRTNRDVDDIQPLDRDVVSTAAAIGVAFLPSGSCGSNFPLNCNAPPASSRLVVDYQL